jgi:hypothetical protein
MSYYTAPELRSPDFRYDVIRGSNWPTRFASRVTLAELERIASELNARILWDCAHRIGVTTVEVTLSNRIA